MSVPHIFAQRLYVQGCHTIPVAVGHHVGHAVPAHAVVKPALVWEAETHLALHSVHHGVVHHSAAGPIHAVLYFARVVGARGFHALSHGLGCGAAAALHFDLRGRVLLHRISRGTAKSMRHFIITSTATLIMFIPLRLANSLPE